MTQSSQLPQEQQPPGEESRLEPRADHGETSYRGSGRLAGKAVAIAFAREGADVLVDPAHCRDVVAKAVEVFGRIDILVSNAAFQHVESFGQNVPLGRPGQPAEVAPVHVMPASDEASYVSGARIAVTGGRPIL